MARRIRDPIHGFVELDRAECHLLDTPPLQRLRRVRQLALASLVYPGALHARFDHTLGVFHVAKKLCHALRIDQDYHRVIQLAALLHDVGHGPFSHVSETVLDALSTENLEASAGKKEKIHELITEKIILEHADFNDCLSPEVRRDVARLLRERLGDRIHRDIISGPLDADKQDYLLRDSYFCGVRYGVFDMDQLHKSLRVGQDANDRILMVDHDGVHALEQFVLAKYYMTTQVYRHKVRLISDNMLIRALSLGVEVDRIPSLASLYRYADTAEYLNEYLTWDDQRVTVELLKPEHQQTHAGQIFRRLMDRRLFKQVATIRRADLSPEAQSALPEKLDKEPSVRSALEQGMAEALSQHTGSTIDPSYVILHSFKIENVRAQSRNSEESIPIQKAGRLVRFEDESTLFQSINESLNETHVECYAPVAYLDEHARQVLIDKATEALLGLIQSRFAENSSAAGTVEGGTL